MLDALVLLTKKIGREISKQNEIINLFVFNWGDGETLSNIICLADKSGRSKT